MGQEVKNQTRFCQIPQFSKKGLNQHLKPRTIMAVGLTFILTTTGLAFYLIQPTPIGGIITDPVLKVYNPQAAIVIDGDANFSDTALLEGWPGDGSPENPFIIDGLNTTPGGGWIESIYIRNTRINFIICNCNYIGAPEDTFGFSWEPGIYLNNVTNGELVNNTCKKNPIGILLDSSNSNTVVNNTCIDNFHGIYLNESVSNTVVNNTCIDNSEWGMSVAGFGICLEHSDSNTVANNICNNNNAIGICLDESSCNTVEKNTCNSNDIGISLNRNLLVIPSNNYEYWTYSLFNTVANNTCNNNRVGIYLLDPHSNTVVNNIFLGNTEHDLLEDFTPRKFDTDVLVSIGFFGLMGFAGIIMLGAGWRMVKLSRLESKGE
jgi:parallel beta-helix repeat protein